MKKILAPIDFSDSSLNALQFAIDLCKAGNAKLYILHSFDMLIEFNEAVDSAMIYQKYFEDCQLKFEDVVREKKNKYLELSIESFFEAGSALDAIKNKSTELDIDLIVMGRTGTSGIESIIMGSTTAKVINHVHIPVLIVPDHLSFDYMLAGGILLATDLKTYPGGKDVRLLHDFLQINTNQIHVLHYPESSDKIETHDEEEAKLLSLLPAAERIEYIRKGTFLETVYFAAEKHKARLLILISRKKTFWQRLFETQRSVKVADDTVFPLLILSENKEEGK